MYKEIFFSVHTKFYISLFRVLNSSESFLPEQGNVFLPLFSSFFFQTKSLCYIVSFVRLQDGS